MSQVCTDHPYATLTPDVLLDAVESCGFQCDGTFLALNSYENRVYQVGIEDKQPVIAKFYRPERWSNDLRYVMIMVIPCSNIKNSGSHYFPDKGAIGLS